MDQLRAVHGEEIIWARVAADKPLLGICVGAQILFESGSEKVGSAGVGLFAGEVSRLSAPVLPHMGWNTVRAGYGSRLIEGLEGASFYFVHSYAAKVAPSDSITSWSEYGEPFIAAIERGPISATQFHPEKSSANGARLIKNWAQTL